MFDEQGIFKTTTLSTNTYQIGGGYEVELIFKFRRKGSYYVLREQSIYLNDKLHDFGNITAVKKFSTSSRLLLERSYDKGNLVKTLYYRRKKTRKKPKASKSEYKTKITSEPRQYPVLKLAIQLRFRKFGLLDFQTTGGNSKW